MVHFSTELFANERSLGRSGVVNHRTDLESVLFLIYTRLAITLSHPESFCPGLIFLRPSSSLFSFCPFTSMTPPPLHIWAQVHKACVEQLCQTRMALSIPTIESFTLSLFRDRLLCLFVDRIFWMKMKLQKVTQRHTSFNGWVVNNFKANTASWLPICSPWRRGTAEKWSHNAESFHLSALLEPRLCWTVIEMYWLKSSVDFFFNCFSISGLEL